jgi:PAS domain S-box-containing protein
MQPEAKVNILLIDDQPENLLALSAILDRLGQNLVKAHSGEEALRCLLKQDFAVILLDVQMLERDGFERARLIRERLASQETAIIFMTTSNRDDIHLLKDYSLGAVDYLLKPIVPEILLSKVAVFISLFNKTQEVKRQAAQLEAAKIELEREIAKRQRAEAAWQRADGSGAWLESIGTNWLFNPDIKAIVANSRDMSDRKQAEEALRQQAERERLIMASAQRIRQTLDLDVILDTTVGEVRQFLEVDRVLVYRLWHDGTGSTVAEAAVPGCQRILGHTFPAEVFPQDVHQLYRQGRIRAIVNPENDEVTPCLVEFLHQLGVKSKLVVPILHQEELWGLLIAHHCSQPRQWQPLEIDLLKQLAIQVTIAIQQADLYQQVQLELTERKQAEEALRESQHFIQKVADTTPVILYVYDFLEERNVYANHKVADLLGYTPEQIQALGPAFIQSILHPDDLAQAPERHKRWETVKEGDILQAELRMRHTTGEWRTFQCKETLFARTPDGLVRQILGAAADITERKRTEEALQQQMERERLIAALTRQIRQSLDLDEILATTVTEIRQLLQADRVLIFRLYPDGTGRVIKEAVVPAWPVTLKMTFPDKCLPQECFQFYCQGQARVVPDVSKDEWASCLVEFMQQVGVKSKVVVPIVHKSGVSSQESEASMPNQTPPSAALSRGGAKIQNPLWGLLIAHACEDYRKWQQGEVDLLGQLANQLAIAIQQADLYQQVQLELTERKQAEAALSKARDELEIRVSERTAELTRINASLEAEISDRQLAEEALRESKRLIQQIADTAPTLLYIYDLSQDCNVYANRQIEEFFGCTQPEIQARGSEFFAEVLHPEDVQHLIELRERFSAAKDGEVIEKEFRMKNARGEWCWFRVCEVIFTRTADGLPEQILGTAIDITDQKQAEEICCALETEKELRKLQLRFFSMASHEFRTPLSTILASAHLLESCAHKWPEEKRLRNLRRIQAAGKNMTQLLNDILTINRAETGKLECHPQPIDLEKFCRHLVEEMQINADSKHKITFLSQGQCRKASVDEKLLRSILTNLLSNASKYSPQGGEVHLALTCEQNEVTFQIQDQGIGIPPEDLPHLFEPFHRGKNVEHIAGTGLGITVVKKCLDLQGGKISLNSQVGVGTTVTVTIPLPTECRLI